MVGRTQALERPLPKALLVSRPLDVIGHGCFGELASLEAHHAERLSRSLVISAPAPLGSAVELRDVRWERGLARHFSPRAQFGYWRNGLYRQSFNRMSSIMLLRDDAARVLS
jgi:hypothetical protein